MRHRDRPARATRRADAAEACRQRFQGKAYKPGTRDCTILALHALRGLNIAVPFAKGLKYSKEADGVRALKAAGFSTLIEAVDSLGFPRIAPAMAHPADIVALETDHKLGALGVAMGNGNVLAFTEHTDTAEVLEGVTGFARDENGDPIAWRVIDG